MHSKVLATQPILLKPFAWAAQGAATAKQISDQPLQFLAEALGWVVGSIQFVWAWSSDQIVQMTQAPWESWPLWKQVLLVIVAAIVLYTLFFAARQLWFAALNVLSAVASLVATLIVILPTVLLAGAIALAGLWVINNFDSLSSLRSPFQGAATGRRNSNTPSPPVARPGPAEAIGGND